MILKKKMTKKN